MDLRYFCEFLTLQMDCIVYDDHRLLKFYKVQVYNNKKKLYILSIVIPMLCSILLLQDSEQGLVVLY